MDWNGVPHLPTGPSITSIVSDASSSWGSGAFDSRSGEWFQLQWPQSWLSINIAIKELIPLVLAMAVWGSCWQGHCILFRSDNMAADSALSSWSACDLHRSHLLHCLFFWEGQYSWEHSAEHIAGKINTAADTISRNNLHIFVSSFVLAQPHSPSAGLTPHEPLLYLSSLGALVQTLFARGITPSTNCTYKSAKRKFLDANLPVIPLTQQTACLFIAHLANQGLHPQSISVYLSALRHFQIEQGLVGTPRSEWPQLQYVLRGIKRSSAGTPIRIRLPSTASIMGCLREVCSPQNLRYEHCLLWTALYVWVFKVRRSLHSSRRAPNYLYVRNVHSHTSPSAIQLVLHRSKMDPFGHGAAILPAVTTAAQVGVLDHLIKTLDRWESEAYLGTMSPGCGYLPGGPHPLRSGA